MEVEKEVAKYIIKSLPVDNLKLQKLLYYSQAVYLVLNNKSPLFDEEIEAWDYGPVVPSVYREYKSNGFDIIIPSDEPTMLNLNEIKAVDMALGCFGEDSGVYLINKTHQESPWKDVYQPGKPSKIITKEAIHSYFKDSLNFHDDEG